MKVDICIPAYNEETIIEESSRAVLAALSGIPNITVRVLVADNGSVDATGERAARVPGVTVLKVPVEGKGAAVIEAARVSDADLFGFVDADLSADPKDLKVFVRALEEGADIVIGSRLTNTGLVHRGFLRTFSSRSFNLLQHLIVGVPVSDTQCGMKLMNAKGRDILRECVEIGWFFDIELLAHAKQGGLNIQELPVHWEEFRFPGRTSKLRILRDAVAGVQAMFRIRNRAVH